MERLNNFMNKLTNPLEPLAVWLLRLGLGIAFILHGMQKFPLPPEKMTKWFTSLGYPYPDIVTSAVAIGELAAGVGVIIGGLFANHIGNAITKVSGGVVFVIMTGAFVIAHGDWFITKKLFMSEQIFLFILGLFFAIRGNSVKR
tara:strand:- start:161 stop:592 length:432 start_codon:yes stop_codon:yes gene_type:complete